MKNVHYSHSNPPSLKRHLIDTTIITVPLAFAQLSQMGMAVTDTILLGQLGPQALAAGGLGAQLFFFITTVMQAIPSTVNVFVAQALGAKKEHDVPQTYWSGMLLCFLLFIPSFLALTFIEPILLALHEPTQLAHNVGIYCDVIRWGTLGSLIGAGLIRSFMPAVGITRILLWVYSASLLINGVLNYGLIHGKFGLPALGLLGSATATAITVWLIAIVLLIILHLRKDIRHLLKYTRPQLQRVKEILNIGWPVTITFGAESLLFLATAITVGTLGVTSLAAHQIAINVASTAFMVPLSIGQAANVRVGYWVGAQQPHAAQRAGFIAIAMGAGFMLLSAKFIFFFPHFIVHLYLDPHHRNNAMTIELAMHLLRIAAIFQLVDGIQTVAAGSLRGFKDTRIPMLSATFAYWGIGFPLGYWLTFHQKFGAAGMWWGLAAGLTCVSILLTYRFYIKSNQFFQHSPNA